MKDMDVLVGEVPALADLEQPQREVIAGCARTAHFEAGEYFFREGDAADLFFAIRHGDVALEVHVPARDAVIIETLHDGDLLGWSWLFEPYSWSFDARAVGSVSAIAFDGACLRGKCAADHDLGYEVMRRFAQVIIERLQATRMRLLDVYGVEASR